MQKAIENVPKNTMGDQGMGCRTPFQMLYVFSLLMKKIRGGGGIKMLDTLWSIVQHEIQENMKWQVEAESNFKQAWEEFLEKVGS